MKRRETPFAILDKLILLKGRISGPRGTSNARLVLDTGASYVTITPELAASVGYSALDSVRRTRVHAALGSEEGYVLEVAKLAVLGIAARGLPVHVFDLGHDDIDGLVGLNFLNLLNYEVRSLERRILVEPAAPGL